MRRRAVAGGERRGAVPGVAGVSVSASGGGSEQCLASSSAGKNASSREGWWWRPRVPPVSACLELRRRRLNHVCACVCV